MLNGRIVSLPDLRRILGTLPDDPTTIERMKEALTLQFQLEYGLLD